MTTAQQLAAIAQRAPSMLDGWRRLRDELLPARRSGHPRTRARRLHGRDPRVPRQLLQDRHLSGADAAGVRPGHPFPYISNLQLTACGGRRQTGATKFAARQGARRAAALHPGARRDAGDRRAELRLPRRRHPAATSASCFRARRSTAPAVPDHPRHRHRASRRTRPTICSCHGIVDRSLKRAALRRRVAAARSSRHARGACSTSWSRTSSWTRVIVYGVGRPLGLAD